MGYNLSSDKQLGSQTSKMIFRLLLVLMAFFALATAKEKNQKAIRDHRNDERPYTPPPRDTPSDPPRDIPRDIPRRCREGVYGPEARRKCQLLGLIGGGERDRSRGTEGGFR